MNEVIENNVTGKICDAWNENEWLSGIEEYCELEYESRKKKALYGVNRIADKFSRSKQISEWNEYFKVICSNS
jgi:hypothetical protein